MVLFLLGLLAQLKALGLRRLLGIWEIEERRIYE